MAMIVANNMQSGFGCEAKLIGADQQTSLLLGLETFIGYREGNGPLAAIIDAMEISDQEFVERAVAHNEQWLPWMSSELSSLGLDVTPSVGTTPMVFSSQRSNTSSGDRMRRSRDMGI